MRSIGVIKALGNKNVAEERLYKSFGTLLRRNMLKQRRCMSGSGKSWSCFRECNQRSLTILRKRLNALKEHMNILLLVYNKRGKIFSQKLLNKSLKLWLNLKVISKSARNKRSGCCIRNKLFCQRTSLLDFHIKRTKCLKRSFTTRKLLASSALCLASCFKCRGALRNLSNKRLGLLTSFLKRRGELCLFSATIF